MSGFEFCDEVHLFNGKPFGKVKVGGKEPLLSTKSIYIGNSSTPKKLSFPISSENDAALFEVIQCLENNTDAALRKITPKHTLNKEAPVTFATVKRYIKDKPNCFTLRPNYTKNETNNEVTGWFKGSDKTELYTWDGTPINSADELGSGEYQFIIKASLVYFGPHNSCGAIANLQARIVALRYNPLVRTQYSNAWDFDTNTPASGNLPAIEDE